MSIACRFRPMTLVRAQRRMKTTQDGTQPSRTVIISCSDTNFYAAGHIAGATVCELGVLVLVHDGPVPSVLLCRGAYDSSCNQRSANVAQTSLSRVGLSDLRLRLRGRISLRSPPHLSSTFHLRVFTILSRFHDFLFL